MEIMVIQFSIYLNGPEIHLFFMQTTISNDPFYLYIELLNMYVICNDCLTSSEYGCID